MSGNSERGDALCPICKRKPAYFIFETNEGVFGWLHDVKLRHCGQPYQVEVAGIYVKRHGRNFDLSSVKIVRVCCIDCGELSKEVADIQWERFKELSANGLLLLPSEGGW